MPLRTVPPGVTCGAGTVNFVNCRLYGPGNKYYPEYGYTLRLNQDWDTGDYGCITSRNLNLYIRYSDFLGPTFCCVETVFCNPPHTCTLDSVYLDGSTRVSGIQADGVPRALFHYFGAPVGAIFPIYDWGYTRASYGTILYPYDYAPIPTTHVLRVGPTRQYTTIEAAYTAAQHGDNIVVDPGTYVMGNVYMTKCVRVYGATQNPLDVIIAESDPEGSSSLFYVYPDRMINVPVEFRGPGFFHVTLYRAIRQASQSAWATTVHIYRSRVPTDANPWDPGEEEPGPTTSPIMFSCNT